MNPVTFLLAAALLVALHAPALAWLLFGIAFVVGLLGRAVATAAKLAAQEKPPQ